jgi:FGGY family of carbohydrate kinases, N-terminal domain
MGGRALRPTVTLGVDVGTSSTKGVLGDRAGTAVRTASREHTVDRPHPGWAERDGSVWCEELASISRELLAPGDVEDRNPAVGTRVPDPAVRARYDGLYSLYRELYPSTAATVHALAARDRCTTTSTEELR